jgi:hypothetical protein
MTRSSRPRTENGAAREPDLVGHVAAPLGLVDAMIPGASYLTIGLGIALGVSLLANAGLTKVYLNTRDQRTVAISDRDSARRAASECSDATDDLRDQAAKRAKESAVEVAAAAARAKTAEGHAAKIASSPQKVPGNVCASAQAEVDEFFTERDAK